MTVISVESLERSQVKLIKHRVFDDERGWFYVPFEKSEFSRMGLPTNFIQESLSYSERRNTVRGLHYQRSPYEQTKLLTVVSGAIFDVAVDLRRDSSNFGGHTTVLLSAGDGRQVLIPAGFAHGFCTLQDNTIVQYKVDRPYKPEFEAGLLWNDPKLGIPWPSCDEDTIVIQRDREWPILEEL